MVAAAAISGCGFSLAPAPAPMAGCHRHPLPLHPQPAEHRCCGSDHRAALVTVIFSPRPVLLELKLATVLDRFTLTGIGDATRVASAPSGGPPSFTLRI